MQGWEGENWEPVLWSLISPQFEDNTWLGLKKREWEDILEQIWWSALIFFSYLPLGERERVIMCSGSNLRTLLGALICVPASLGLTHRQKRGWWSSLPVTRVKKSWWCWEIGTFPPMSMIIKGALTWELSWFHSRRRRGSQMGYGIKGRVRMGCLGLRGEGWSQSHWEQRCIARTKGGAIR